MYWRYRSSIAIDAPFLSLEREDGARASQRIGQRVDLGGGRVDVEASAGGRDQPQALMQRLRAMVSGAHSDGVAIQQRGQVVGMNLTEGEADRAAAPSRRGAVDRQVGNRAQALHRVCRQRLLMRVDPFHAERAQ